MIIPPLKKCPWCRSIPDLEVKPLWNGSHGYYGKYEYYIACKNEKCKINPRTKSYDDVYDMKEEDCIINAAKDWNRRS